MAEERLIDDDKDRKYKIRINENGEEELVIDEDGEDEESDIPVFAIPDFDEDDEEAAVLTPEQLAERERIKKEEEAARAETVAKLIQKANQKLEEGDYEGAKYAVTQAEEVNETDGEVCSMKFKIITRDMTEFLNLEECAEAAVNVKQYSSEEAKEHFKSRSAMLKGLIDEAEAKTEALSKENEQKKEERRDTFLKIRTKSLGALLGTAGPFIIFLLATIVLSTFMFADQNGAYLIATIVLAALTVIALIATVIAARKYWAAARDVKLNEKDTSTKLGREYLENKKQLELLKRIYDIS